MVTATEAVEQGQADIDALNLATEAMVVEAFVNPPSDNALDPFRSETISQTMVKQALVDIQSDTDADLLDQLEQAHEDLEVAKAERRRGGRGRGEAVTAEDALAEVENALAEQEAFAADVEERLNAKLAEAESLKTFDRELADRLVREQAEVAARLGRRGGRRRPGRPRGRRRGSDGAPQAAPRPAPVVVAEEAAGVVVAVAVRRRRSTTARSPVAWPR